MTESGALVQWGNATTHNLETVLHANVMSSRYSRGLEQLEFNELVDEIYANVTHVEPWMSGNARGPSTAFCCLNRLFELHPTPRQVRLLLQHEDSPYIRAVGFLFLRYVAEPRTLWSWVEEFLRDKEEFSPSADENKKVAMGLFIRELLLDQFYFETIFPRIPENISRTLKDNLARLGFATVAVGCAGVGGTRRQGGGAADEGPSRRPPSVKAALAVSLGQRAPHVAGVREDGRGFGNVDPTRAAAAAAGAHRDGQAAAPAPRPVAPFEPPRERDRDRDREYDRDRGRDRAPERRDEHRHWRRSRSRSRNRHRRSRSRSRDRHHSHHRRSRSRDRDRQYRRSRSRSRSRGRGRRERSREPPSRAEAPPSAEAAGRSTNDVFRALAPPLMAPVKERY